MTQKILKFYFREAKDRKNYIIGESNLNAIMWIDKYPNWQSNGLVIEGPRSSGKSHLVRVWQEKSNCSIFNSKHINQEDVDLQDNKNIAIENLEKIKNYEFFLHLINFKKENKLKYLLTTSTRITSLKIRLNDIKSRLLALPNVKISLPTDEILEGLIIKLLKDYGLLVDEKLVKYMINRIERSYEGVNFFIKELNQASLERKKKISIALIKEVLRNRDTNDAK